MNLYISSADIFVELCSTMLYFLMIFTKTDRKIEFYNVFYFIELTDINEVSSPLLSYVAGEFCVWIMS